MINTAGKRVTRVVFAFLAVAIVLGLSYAASARTPQIKADEKSKVSGTIVARSGDLVQVKDKKTGQLVVVSISDTTKIERKKGKVEFFRHKDMDVTAMVPGLTIDAEGVGNAKGQLAASKITFIPDEFAVEVAEEQQIMANKAAARAGSNYGKPGRSRSRAGSKFRKPGSGIRQSSWQCRGGGWRCGRDGRGCNPDSQQARFGLG